MHYDTIFKFKMVRIKREPFRYKKGRGSLLACPRLLERRAKESARFDENEGGGPCPLLRVKESARIDENEGGTRPLLRASL